MDELEKIPAEIKKEGHHYKKLFFVVVLLGIVIIAIFFFSSNKIFPQPATQTQIHQYKISLTHNGKPLDFNNSEIGSGVLNYVIYLTKDSSCPIVGEEYVTAKSDYTFDSNYSVDLKTLESYEKEGYAFTVGVDTQKWYVELEEKNSSSNMLTYSELPKLSRDFSINFEIPIFNSSPSSYWLKKENGTVQLHVELIDNWQKNNSFYCRVHREYDSAIDGSLPNCSLLRTENEFKLCTIVYVPKCEYLTNRVIYIIPAERNGKSIDCNFSLNELTAGKSYNVDILESEIEGNFIKMFKTFRPLFNNATFFVS